MQFTGSSHEPLTLELPLQGLSAKQLARARALFASSGGRETATGLQLTLGRDAARGAELATEIFSEVFHTSRPLGSKPTDMP